MSLPIFVHLEEVKESLQKEDVGIKNIDTSEEEEDFDKEASCFNSFKENITHDVLIRPDN